MKYNFKIRETEITAGQKFGRPTITQAGKTKDVYDMIQEGREDTEIYPTLEKYGSLKRMELDKEGVFADLTEYKGLRELKQIQEKADNLWANLPLQVRQEFHHDKNRFLNEGEQWIQTKINQETKQAQAEPAEGAKNV